MTHHRTTCNDARKDIAEISMLNFSLEQYVLFIYRRIRHFVDFVGILGPRGSTKILGSPVILPHFESFGRRIYFAVFQYNKTPQ